MAALAAARRAVEKDVQSLGTPLERACATTLLLQELPGLQRTIARMRMQAVAELRKDGWSYRRIASELGLSPNAIAQVERQHLSS